MAEAKRDLFGDPMTARLPVERANLANALRHALENASSVQLVQMLTNEFVAVDEYLHLLNFHDHTPYLCRETSLLFNPHRLEVAVNNSNSIVQRFMQEVAWSNLARQFAYRFGAVNRNLLQALLSQGMSGNTQMAQEFPPVVARDICRHFGVHQSSKVLDPCAGWGGRMLGVSAVADSYTCFDTSPATCSGLRKLLEFIQRLRPTFQARIAHRPYEDAKLPANYFDFALTSPPYYNVEAYSDDPNDSAHRWTTFDAWLEGFFRPLVANTVRALKPGGCFVLNIGSRRYPLRKCLISMFGAVLDIREMRTRMHGNAGFGRKADGEAFFVLRSRKRQTV